MSRKRHTDAQECLNALLDRYEAAPERSQKIYEHICDHFPSLTGEESFRNTMTAAQTVGAVRLYIGRGETAHLMIKIELIDPDCLFVFLSRTPRLDRTLEAKKQIFQRLEGQDLSAEGEKLLYTMLDAWQHGKALYKLSLDMIDVAYDFLRAFNAVVTRSETDERDLRTFSRQSCGDSKLIESHKSRIIAEAVRQGLVPEELDAARIDTHLGLEKFPHLIQVAGALPLLRQIKHDRLHFGLHADVIKDLEVSRFDALTTIENYASFNRHIREAMGPSEVVIYTGGWPGRAERALIGLLAPHASNVFHWGDIDTAGLGIADAVWKAADRPVTLHLMSSEIARKLGNVTRSQPKLKVEEASPAFEMMNWLGSEEGRVLEQEEIDPVPVSSG